MAARSSTAFFQSFGKYVVASAQHGVVVDYAFVERLQFVRYIVLDRGVD